jgi:hypothetical protein
MTTPEIDPIRVSFHLIGLPKGAKGSRGAAFIGAEPAGSYVKGANKMFLCTARGATALGAAEEGAPLGPEPIHVGALPTGPKGSSRAVAWTIRGTQAHGAYLAAADFVSTRADAADGMQIVGAGVSAAGLERALLWQGNAAPLALSDPGDAAASSAAYAVCGSTQGGSSGHMAPHASLWRGTAESFINLHPPGADTSCVRGVDDDQQVGEFEPSTDTGAAKHAALWQGSADSFVDLTPAGVATAVATCCGGGLQAGWIEEAPRSQRFRARLWAGAAERSLDLHALVGGEWTASMIRCACVHGDRLRLLGTVEKRQASGRYTVLVAEQACWWEVALA